MKVKILQIREGTGEALTNPAGIAKAMAEEGKADREIFWVLHLNTDLKIVEKELVAMGTLDRANIHPREVFKKAIINSAHSIITVHNHPGGMTEPSKSDLAIWEQLKKAGEIIGINILDNIIITPSGKYYSENETHYL